MCKLLHSHRCSSKRLHQLFNVMLSDEQSNANHYTLENFTVFVALQEILTLSEMCQEYVETWLHIFYTFTIDGSSSNSSDYPNRSWSLAFKSVW
jgi:hypothetical protein